jgi:hypothetical protein
MTSVIAPQSLRERFAGKPSAVLRIAAQGVLSHLDRNDFEFDMNVFGNANPETGVCYGCLATATLEEAAGVRFQPDEITPCSARAATLNLEWLDVSYFEYAIDSVRKGGLGSLLHFCGVEKESLPAEFEEFFNSALDTVSVAGRWSDSRPSREKLHAFVAQLGDIAAKLEAIDL